jgi:hypothetical protein
MRIGSGRFVDLDTIPAGELGFVELGVGTLE